MSSGCKACNDLREYAPEFVANGVTDNVCNSLANNTGLNPSLSPVHDNVSDLHDVNDCIIKNMQDEIEAYEVCSWKQFMKKFIPNVYNTFKAIICSLKALNNEIFGKRIDINFAKTDLDPTDSSHSHLVAGRGTSFLEVKTSPTLCNVHLKSYGKVLYMTGLLSYHAASQGGEYFTEPRAVWHYDQWDGDFEHGTQRLRAAYLDDTFYQQRNGRLVLEMRIKNEDLKGASFPSFATAMDTGNAVYTMYVHVFKSGSKAYGLGVKPNTSPIEEAPDHVVPNGWTYIQFRVKKFFTTAADSATDIEGATFQAIIPFE